MLHTILCVLQVPVSVGVICMWLLHSGKDAGMSGAFGVGVAGGSAGGSLMERNLDRWTIVFPILFGDNTTATSKTQAILASGLRPLLRSLQRIASRLLCRVSRTCAAGAAR